MGDSRIVKITNQGEVQFFEAAASGSNKASLKAPTTLAADYTLTLPVDDGTASQFLQTDGSGNLSWGTGTSSLQSAYNSGSTIAVDASNPISISQSNNLDAVRITKTGTSTGEALDIHNDGSGDALKIVQDGLGVALQITQNAASQSLNIINTAAGNSINITCGDAAGIYAAQANNQPVASLNKTGTGVGTLLSLHNDGTGDCLNINQDGNGKALVITNDGTNNAVDITNSTGAYGLILANATGIAASISSSVNGTTVNINKTGATTGTCLNVDNDGTGAGIHIEQDGAGIGLDIKQDGNAVACQIVQTANQDGIYIDKTATGGTDDCGIFISDHSTGYGLYVNKIGHGTGLHVYQQSTHVAVGIDKAESSDAALYITSEGGTGQGIYITGGTGNDIEADSGAWLTQAGDWHSVSSVDVKKDFEELVKEDILSKIRSLWIPRYKYKANDEVACSPMSEDVNREFGLGFARQTSAKSLASIGLIGIQALVDRVIALEAKVLALETK